MQFGIEDVTQPQDRAALDAALRCAWDRALPRRAFAGAWRRAGVVCSITASGVRDAAGALYLIVVVEDLTEPEHLQALRVAHAALEASETRFRRIVETANEGLWIVDEAGRTTFANNKMEELLGYAADEMLGQRYDSFLMPLADGKGLELLGRPRAGSAGSVDIQLRRRDGKSLWTLMSTHAAARGRPLHRPADHGLRHQRPQARRGAHRDAGAARRAHRLAEPHPAARSLGARARDPGRRADGRVRDRPRSLQGGQRRLRARGGRQPAAGAGPPVGCRDPAQRHAGAVRWRRVRRALRGPRRRARGRASRQPAAAGAGGAGRARRRQLLDQREHRRRAVGRGDDDGRGPPARRQHGDASAPRSPAATSTRSSTPRCACGC